MNLLIIILFFYTVNVLLLARKKKIVKILSEFSRANIFDIASLIFGVSIIFLFPGYYYVNIFIIVFFNLYFTVIIRHIYSLFYFEYFKFTELYKEIELKVDKKIFSFDSVIKKLLFNRITNNLVFDLLLGYVDIRIWFFYWVLAQYFYFFNCSLNDEFDKAILGKFYGEDIILNGSGKLKIELYKKSLLDIRTDINSEIENYNGDFFGAELYYEEKDFYYKDPKIEYLASINCV